MTDLRSATAPTDPAPRAPRDAGGPGPRFNLLLAVAMILIISLLGSPAIQAPWIQGDEFIFVVNNPDVTGADGSSFLERVQRIFEFPPREDLYQPIPLMTYLVEWELWDGQAGPVRRTDVCLHAINALLLWWLLRRLLMREQGTQMPPASINLLAWLLALAWAVHPVLVTAYAADMGRTHLLSATFSLLALLAYLRNTRTGNLAALATAITALLAAMLSKPVPGWFLLAALIEARHNGWRNTLRSCRLYLVTLICITFAALTYWTTQRSGIIADTTPGLFGDPIARAALGIYLYTRNILLPLNLSTWYLPDPNTNWTYPPVWIGLILALATAVHAIRTWQRPTTQSATLGWVWWWATLLPVLGIVGAREVAAVDRYLYQPLMGLMLVVGTLLTHWASRTIGRESETADRIAARRSRNAASLVAIIAAIWAVVALPYVRVARSTIMRAQRFVTLNPGDPRALEGLAAAYAYARNNPLLPEEEAAIQLKAAQTPAVQKFMHFTDRAHEALVNAAETPDLPVYFPTDQDRAAFHRRLSFALNRAADAPRALEQAMIARELEPDAFSTWKRLAHAFQALDRFDDARRAYAQCEVRLNSLTDNLGDSAARESRAAHHADYAYLLLFELGNAQAARPHYEAALQTGVPAVRRPAMIGLALCEIRAGIGAKGLEMITEVLREHPRDHQAMLVLGEYHLRSHHWPQALQLYERLVAQDPADYRALRGLQTTCAQLGAWRRAAEAWEAALQTQPDNREFQSFFVWSAACADETDARIWIDDLLDRDPNNPLACAAAALIATRAGNLDRALNWIRQAQDGTPLHNEPPLVRLATAIRLQRAQGTLPPEAELVELIALAATGHEAAAKDRLRTLGSGSNNFSKPAQRILEQLSERLTGENNASESPQGDGS